MQLLFYLNSMGYIDSLNHFFHIIFEEKKVNSINFNSIIVINWLLLFVLSFLLCELFAIQVNSIIFQLIYDHFIFSMKSNSIIQILISTVVMIYSNWVS